MKKTYLPVEIDLYYLIPALKRELAFALLKRNLKQKEIAKLLNSTEAAISQYLKGKRGNIVDMRKIRKEIERSAENIVKKKSNLVREITKLVKIASKKGIKCKVCEKYNRAIIKYCKCKIC